jgi:hypothetical protein
MKTPQEIETVCSQVAHKVKKDIPSGMGFVLLVSNLGPGGFTAYMSSQVRADTIKLLREMADLLERDGQK